MCVSRPCPRFTTIPGPGQFWRSSASESALFDAVRAAWGEQHADRGRGVDVYIETDRGVARGVLEGDKATITNPAPGLAEGAIFGSEDLPSGCRLKAVLRRDLPRLRKWIRQRADVIVDGVSRGGPRHREKTLHDGAETDKRVIFNAAPHVVTAFDAKCKRLGVSRAERLRLLMSADVEDSAAPADTIHRPGVAGP